MSSVFQILYKGFQLLAQYGEQDISNDLNQHGKIPGIHHIFVVNKFCYLQT